MTPRMMLTLALALGSVAVTVAVPAAAVEDDAFRNTRPPPGPPPKFTPPTATTFPLPKLGATAVLVEQHALPIVEISYVIDVGGSSDPRGKDGMAELCTGLVGEGTRTLTKSAFEEKKADLALSMAPFAGAESSGVSLSVPKAQLAPSLALLVDMLTQPGLREADLARLRARMKASVVQARGAPESIGGRVVGRVLYGDAHPLGGVVAEQTLDAVTLDDCRAVAGRLRPGGATLFVAGDVSRAELEGFASTMAKTWTGQAPRRATTPAPKPLRGTVFFVDVPGAAQSRVIVAHAGPLRTAADYVPTSIMAAIYGGGFSSRVNMNLREKNGFTYGARGGFSYTRDGSMFATSSSIRTDATAKALGEIAAELKAMQQSPPTDAELVREREGALLGLPAQFSTAGRTAGSLQELLFFGLPLDTYQKLPDQLRAVDNAAVLAAAKAYLKTSGVKVIVVGDGARVRADLEALARQGAQGGFGGEGFVVLDADGRPQR